MHTPKFTQVKPSFHAELKNRIQLYFEQSGKKMTGNYKLWLKAIFLLVIFTVIYVHLVFFSSVTWVAIVECVLLGGVISAIGFNVMHDGAHGSFSDNSAINKLAAITLGLLGGSPFMWNIKHNIIHHAYTNIDGVDDDINAEPFLRMASTQKRYSFHKYQHFYFWFFYSLLYIYWIFGSDYKKYFRKKIGDIPLKKMDSADHFYFWLYKIIHLFVFIIIPFIVVGVVPALTGFLIATLVAGIVTSIVFQLAHTVEHTSFPIPAESTGKLEDEWAIHQIKTTANFATGNKLISWFVGGLNFQIEHHLFPKISHVHYPAISKIIKQACNEYGIAYVEYPKMYKAVASHISFLRKMGKQ